MTVNEILCNNIARLRKESTLSQEALANKLGVTFQAVSKWENNQSCPDLALIPVMAEIFNVSTDYLFGREDEEQGRRINDDLLDWEDNDTLYAMVFKGHRLLKGEEINHTLANMNITFEYTGPAHDIFSHFSIEMKNTEVTDGNIHAGTHIICGGVHDSNIDAGTHIICADVTGNGNIDAGTHVTAANIKAESIQAGTGISAKTNIECREMSAGTDIRADAITGENISSGLNIVCTTLNTSEAYRDKVKYKKYNEKTDNDEQDAGREAPSSDGDTEKITDVLDGTADMRCADQNLEEELKKLEQRRKNLQSEIERLQQESSRHILDELSDRLEELKEISEFEEEVSDALQELGDMKAEKQVLEAELMDLEQRRKDVQSEVARLQEESAQKLSTDILDELSEKLEELKEICEELEEKREEIEEIEDEIEDKKNEIEDEIQDRLQP